MTAATARHNAPPTAIRPPWRWAAAGALAGLLVAVAWCAPADWLARGLARASSDRLQLHQAQGSVWNGSARLQLSAGTGSTGATALPGRLQWTVRPRWNGLQLALEAPCCLDTPWEWQLRFGLQGLQLQATDLAPGSSHFPAAMLTGLGTPWNTVRPQGTLALHSRSLQVELNNTTWSLQGMATLDALGMRTALSTLEPLGSYRLVLEGGPSPQLALSTLDGKLLLSGQGQLAQGRWRFAGEARSDAASQAALGNLLNIIGRREGARSVITLG